jgi:hypothetical protein
MLFRRKQNPSNTIDVEAFTIELFIDIVTKLCLFECVWSLDSSSLVFVNERVVCQQS